MRKGKFINFEWLCDYNKYTADEFDVIKTKLIKRDVKSAAEQGYNVVVGLYLLDGFLQQSHRPEKLVNHLNDIKDYALSLGIKELYVVSGHGETLEGLPVESFYFDLNLRFIKNSYKHEFDSLPSYNPDSSKFLFLTGMPDRANRIGLMSKFYDANMLKDAEWSFFAPWAPEDKHWCRNHLQHYTDDQYNQFLVDCERSFDDRYESAKPFYGSYTSQETTVDWYDVVDTEWVQAPAHIDPRVFDDIAVSIISEGPNFWSDDYYDFVTEKTWRAFLMKQPIIFAGWPGQFKYLKKLGYKTFEEYMIIPEYALIEDENERLDAVVKNTQHFLKTHQVYKDNILKDVEHNYNLLHEYIKKQDDLLTHFSNVLNISDTEISHYTEIQGYKNLLMRVPDNV